MDCSVVVWTQRFPIYMIFDLYIHVKVRVIVQISRCSRYDIGYT